MKTAIYTRVSQDGRGDARSVGEQEKECRAWVAREGWDEIGLWSDNDRSASKYAKKQRPGWQALTARLDEGGVDALVVWEPSRATRDRRVWAALAATCEERGIRFGCNGRLYDLNDPDDAFQLDLFFALATRESGTTRKRVLRSMRGAAAAGRPHGKLLYGYRRVYREGRNGPELVEQVVDEDKAAVVREAARRIMQGEALYKVARDFNDRAIPAPRGATWDPTQIKRLCINPAYIAKRTHKGVVVGDGLWPAILDEQTFYSCVSRLSDPSRLTHDGRGVQHLLSGIAVCGVCDGRVRVQKNRSHLAYLCVDGFHVSRKKQDVEDFISALVIERLSRPDLASLMAPRDTDDGAATAAAEAAELRARLEAFYDEAATGGLSPSALARIESRLLPQIQDAEKRARRSHSAPLLDAVAGPDAGETWSRLSLEQKRELIGLLCTIRILRGTPGARSFDPNTVEIVWRGDDASSAAAPAATPAA
jgi:site-specific DNA recombinase